MLCGPCSKSSGVHPGIGQRLLSVFRIGIGEFAGARAGQHVIAEGNALKGRQRFAFGQRRIDVARAQQINQLDIADAGLRQEGRHMGQLLEP